MLARLASELLAALAPPACAACGGAITHAGETVCPACRRGLVWLRPPVCPRCALPAPCAPCPAVRAAFDRAWAPLAYDGTARALVAALKFRGAVAAADAMAAQILAGAPAPLLAGATLVPVPAHPARRRRRGYDQAEELARALAGRGDLPLSTCLRRTGTATRQLGAGAAARRARGRIELRVEGAVPATITLVDDVHTTGATLDACAAALRAAGARSVRCVAYARTLA